VQAVSPRLAVIQVGADNTFRHPNHETLDRLHNIEVLRTDLNGRVEVVSDGKRLSVQPQER
jgi:competence protein ComEC